MNSLYIYILLSIYIIYCTQRLGDPKLKTTRNGTVKTNISHFHRLHHWSPPLAFDKSQLSTGFHPLGDQMSLLVAAERTALRYEGRSAYHLVMTNIAMENHHF